MFSPPLGRTVMGFVRLLNLICGDWEEDVMTEKYWAAWSCGAVELLWVCLRFDVDIPLPCLSSLFFLLYPPDFPFLSFLYLAVCGTICICVPPGLPAFH